MKRRPVFTHRSPLASSLLESLPIEEGKSSTLELQLFKMRVERTRLKYVYNERLWEYAIAERQKSITAYPTDGCMRFETALRSISHEYFTKMATLIVQQCELLATDGGASFYGTVLEWSKERLAVGHASSTHP
jgi:hypothetical protein